MTHDTVVIVGAGANDFFWKPIECACETVQTGLSEKWPAMDFMALLVFQMRMFHRQLQRNPKDKKTQQAYADRNSLYKKLAKEVRKELAAAESNGKLNTPKHATPRQIIERADAAFITVNWDTMLESKLNAKNVIYLHGSVKPSHPLLIPTEVVWENYRTKAAGRDLGNEHIRAVEAIRDARRIIVWGCSLSPYDAEMLVVMGEAKMLQQTEAEWFVIDPSDQPAKRIYITSGKQPTNLWVP